MNKYEELLRWTATEIKLEDKFFKNNQAHTMYPRGNVYGCYLGINIGHEKSRLEARPCLVVSNDDINSKSTNVIIVPLTKDIKYKSDKSKTLSYPWHYVLRRENYHMLEFDSAIQCEDVRCVSKVRLGELICTVNEYDMREIEKRLKRTLYLTENALM